MRTLKTIITTICMLVGLIVFGQVDQEIISIGERELTVGQANKIAENPSTIDTTSNRYQMDYMIIPRQVEVEYDVKPIKAAKLNVKEPLTKLYRGYVKAGVGMYTTPLVQARYNSIRSRDWAYGIGIDHLSSNGGLNDLPNSAYSDNVADIWARKYLKKHTLQAGLNYERNVNRYYGFDLNDIPEDSLFFKQRYSTVGFRAALQSYHRDSAKINHRVWASFRALNSINETKESNFQLGASLSKWEGIYKFGLDADIDINSVTCGPNILDPDVLSLLDFEPIELDNTIIDISPSIKTQTGDLTATIGMGIVTDGQDGTRFRFYPRAYVSYSLFDDLFTPYAGLTGDLERNSLHSLSRENPFIIPCPGLENTSTNYDLYAGIRGTIIDDLSFNAKVSVRNIEDQGFFVNYTDSANFFENGFIMAYDDMRQLGISGELSYRHSDDLTFTGRLALNTFTPDDLEEAFNLPGVEFSANAIYDLDDQFVVKATIFAVGNRWGATTIPNGVDAGVNGLYKQKLRSYVDSNLSFEYRYTKKISAFLELNNITGGKYPRWYRYPVQPFLALGGLTYSF